MRGELVTVFGGSGFVGRHVVRELAKRGARVRVAVRRPHLAHFLRPLGVPGQIELRQANLRYRPSVADALEGATAAVNLVGLLAEVGPQKFSTLHVQGASSIAEFAAKRGIDRVVHVSAIGADPKAESRYARTKAEGEAAVRKLVPSATVLRPSIVFGPQDEFFNRFANMARYSPVLPSIGFGRTKFQPVYVDDVADAVCAALARPEAAGRTYELGGPEVYDFNALMKLMLKVIDRKRLLLPIPFFAAELMGLAGDIVGALPLIDPPLTRDQVLLLKHDNVVGASGEEGLGTLADLGVRAETLEAILPTYLERFRKYGQFATESAA